MQMSNKLVDPTRANIQQDSFTTTTMFSSTSLSGKIEENTHATSNTTFTQNTPRFSAGPAIRVTNGCSEDFM